MKNKTKQIIRDIWGFVCVLGYLAFSFVGLCFYMIFILKLHNYEIQANGFETIFVWAQMVLYCLMVCYMGAGVMGWALDSDIKFKWHLWNLNSIISKGEKTRDYFSELANTCNNNLEGFKEIKEDMIKQGKSEGLYRYPRHGK